MDNFHRAFLVQLLPDTILKRWHGSQAANNFFRNVISCGVFDQIVSLVPICVADDVRQICSEMPEIDQVVQCRFFPHRGIGRAFNMLFENLQLFLKLCRAKQIWFYNITSCNLIAFLLLRLCRKNVYVILADFTPPVRFWDIHRLDGWCIRHASGILALSGRTNFKHRNLQVLPGIVPETAIQMPDPATEPRTYFLFSGKLGAVTGIDMALRVFREEKELPLVITGSGDCEQKIREETADLSNIRYLGNLPFAQYQKILAEATWALSFRDPALPENIYNFPSKILEYLAMGKIVLSTIEYPELSGFHCFYANFDEKSIRNALRAIATLSPAETRQIQEQNRRLLKNFSPEKWAKTFLRIEEKA